MFKYHFFHQNGLPSYALKTILLWASEKRPPTFWNLFRLSECVLGLLDDIIHCVAKRRCPHYFVPEIDLFEHMSCDHLRDLAKCLVKMRHDPITFLSREGVVDDGLQNWKDAMDEWARMGYEMP